MTACTHAECPCWGCCDREFAGVSCGLWDEHRQEVRDMMREANRRMRDRWMLRRALGAMRPAETLKGRESDAT